MMSRWNGDLGEAARRVAPAVWPGLPLPQAVATSANSTSATEYITSAGFPEMGYYQFPESTYNRLRCDAEVQQALGGRCASTDWRTDIAGQVAVGLTDRRRDGQQLASGSPVGNQWTWVTGEMAYVMGSSSARALLQKHAADVAAVPDEMKFAQLIVSATPSATRNEARMLIRTWQRLKTGELLAQQVGQPTGWYQVPLQNADAYERALAVKYPGGGGVEPPTELDGRLVEYRTHIDGRAVALLTVSGLILAAGAWSAYRAHTGQPLLPRLPGRR